MIKELKQEIDEKIKNLHGALYCDKCGEEVTKRTMARGLNKNYCQTCYIILELIEDKYCKGELRK